MKKNVVAIEVKKQAEIINKGVAILKVEEVSIEFLKPYEKNSKVHDKSHIEKLAANIQREGLQESLLIEECGLIVAGHGRWEALKSLGWETVPVRIMKGYTKAQCMIHRVSSNLTVSTKYDSALQSEELRELKGLLYEDIGLDELAALTGFTERDIEVLSENISELADLSDFDIDLEEPTEATAVKETEEEPKEEAKSVSLAKLFGFGEVNTEQAKIIRRFLAVCEIEDAETLTVFSKEALEQSENLI